MAHYAGIDVSLELSSVCVVEATGRIVREAKVASEPEALVGFFRQLGLPLTRVGPASRPSRITPTRLPEPERDWQPVARARRRDVARCARCEATR